MSSQKKYLLPGEMKNSKSMNKSKRILIATLGGILFGIICYLLASSSTLLPCPVRWQIISSRTLIGFAIGISCITCMHWALHGLLMGFLFSLPLAFSGLMAPETPEFSSISMFVFTIVLGMIYGFLIELLTSVIFKVPPYVENKTK